MSKALKRGCATAALGSEMPRQAPEVRRVATRRIKEMIDLVARQSPDWGQKGAHEHALVTVATMVGALMLARAVDDAQAFRGTARGGAEAPHLHSRLTPLARKALLLESKYDEHHIHCIHHHPLKGIPMKIKRFHRARHGRLIRHRPSYGGAAREGRLQGLRHQQARSPSGPAIVRDAAPRRDQR